MKAMLFAVGLALVASGCAMNFGSGTASTNMPATGIAWGSQQTLPGVNQAPADGTTTQEGSGLSATASMIPKQEPAKPALRQGPPGLPDGTYPAGYIGTTKQLTPSIPGR